MKAGHFEILNILVCLRRMKIKLFYKHFKEDILLNFVNDMLPTFFGESIKNGEYFGVYLGLKKYHSLFIKTKPIKFQESIPFYCDILSRCLYNSIYCGDIRVFREFFKYPQADWQGAIKIANNCGNNEVLKEILNDDRCSPKK
jgi:hypothetical protein